MKCLRCEETLPHLLCNGCGGKIPEGSRFCCWCGNPISTADETNDQSERMLCSDGSCIGVINERGVCNVCGKPSIGA